MPATRRVGLTALYLGLFAAGWFSVPSADGALRTVLVVASWAALLTALGGLVRVLRSSGAGSAGRDRAADRRYLLIVLAEFAAAGLGALLLSLAGRSAYVPVLVAAVVGAHFFPLVPVLGDPGLKLLGTAICVVALAALITGLATSTAPGLVAGAGTGAFLLAYAVAALLRGSGRATRADQT